VSKYAAVNITYIFIIKITVLTVLSLLFNLRKTTKWLLQRKWSLSDPYRFLRHVWLECGEKSAVWTANSLRTFRILNSGPTDVVQFRYFFTNRIISKTIVYHTIFGTSVWDLNYGTWAGKFFVQVVKIK
jgi:hypothetical protein